MNYSTVRSHVMMLQVKQKPQVINYEESKTMIIL